MSHVLKVFFDVDSASELVLCPVTVDITSLVVDCGNVRVPFVTRLHTFIRAVSEINDVFTLWLGSPISVVLQKEKFNLNTHLQCNKVECDIRRGMILLFEDLHEKGIAQIVAGTLRYTVEVDTSKALYPR